MSSKAIILNCVRDILEKQDEDMSAVFEEVYKEKVTLNTLISLMIKKGIISKEEFKAEMIKIRKEIRDE